MGKAVTADDRIHIGTFLTDMYINYAGASLESLFENTTAKITVHIMCSGKTILSRENRERLVRFADSFGQQIVFHELPLYLTDELAAAIQAKVEAEGEGRFFGGGIESYAKLIILKILPPEVKRYISFGMDVIFHKTDIRELWEIDLGEYGVAAASELEATCGYMVPKAICNSGVVPYDKYFCCEIMVFDLDKVRAREDILIPGLKLLREHPEYNCVEQDILNYYYARYYKKFPIKYHTFVDGLRSAGVQKIEPCIYHYAGQAINILQPDDVYTRLFLDYFSRSPFCNGMFLYNAFSMANKRVEMERVCQRDLIKIARRRRIALAGLREKKEVLCHSFAISEGDYIEVSFDKKTNSLEISALISCMAENKEQICVFLYLDELYNLVKRVLEDNGFRESSDFRNGTIFLDDPQGREDAEFYSGRGKFFELKS